VAIKQFSVPDIGEVHVYKRSGVRNLRLSIRSDGSIRVTIPAWAPYVSGVNFVQSKADWIKKHAVQPAGMFVHGQAIGKSHRLVLVPSVKVSKPATRVKNTEVIVKYPARISTEDPSVQKAIEVAGLRAMKLQAAHLLPQRLETLARSHGFAYKDVSVKHLKTRWGSCDQDKNIILNLYLMQLPWHLIDYVLLHELTHTKIMRHGPPFWTAMEQVEPKTQALRREIKAYKTSLR
jgi:predicted metal-dependent hydrolase